MIIHWGRLSLRGAVTMIIHRGRGSAALAIPRGQPAAAASPRRLSGYGGGLGARSPQGRIATTGRALPLQPAAPMGAPRCGGRDDVSDL